MRIGVLSDTHSRELPTHLIETLQGLNLDLIIHCGDYTGKKVVEQLNATRKFVGVAGNMDPPEIHQILKKKEILEVEGKRVGIFHGYGFFTDEKLINEFKNEAIDLYVYGHTHELRKEIKGGVYYINPGAYGKSIIVINIDKQKGITLEVIRV